MLNQIQISYPEISNTIYVVVRNTAGKVWNGSSFETWVDGSIGNYDVPCTYMGGNLYSVDFPASIPRGYYTIQIVIQAGEAPSTSDLPLDGALGYWDPDAGNLLPVRVDTLVEYSDGERFSEKALETGEPTGVGNVKKTYTVNDDEGNPIDGVDVWVTTDDEAGANVVASGVTNIQGQIDFYLNAGTYYVWSQKAGYNFTNPDTEVVS